MKILITGGAGFVGSSLARYFKQYYEYCRITVLDNLKRRGSELNLVDFKKNGIEFVHGDVRIPSDFSVLAGDFDLIVDASAEPSVHAGTRSVPDHVVGANLTGTFNCLNFARERSAAFVFLSTSRVYSIAPLRQLQLAERATRFEIEGEGISENFPTDSARSFYGTTKLAGEMLLQEFVATYGMTGIIYRCSVVAGPGQFGKVDQGVFTLWLVNHYFRKPLQYTGFGGKGKQVRDLLHPFDLGELITLHLPTIPEHNGKVFNVGGGRRNSVSLAELTDICRELTGNSVPIGCIPETAAVDIPVFITDNRRIHETLGWTVERDLSAIFGETLAWIQASEPQLHSLFC